MVTLDGQSAPQRNSLIARLKKSVSKIKYKIKRSDSQQASDELPSIKKVHFAHLANMDRGISLFISVVDMGAFPNDESSGSDIDIVDAPSDQDWKEKQYDSSSIEEKEDELLR